VNRLIRWCLLTTVLAFSVAPVAADAQALHRARRSMRFEFSENADSLFVLFGPTREGEWATGWTPRFIFPADGAQVAEGAVFTTAARHDGQGIAYWVMNEYDVVARRVRYVRVVPEATAIQLDITVTPIARSRARVDATYTYTAFTEQGNAAVDAFATEAGSVRTHWERAINDYLGRRATRPR
jgi:hypothetical protein